MKLKNKLTITLTTLAAGSVSFQQVDAATVFDHLGYRELWRYRAHLPIRLA